MNLGSKKLRYSLFVVLGVIFAALVYFFIFKSSNNLPKNTVNIPLKTDAVLDILDKNLEKEEKNISREGDQVKVIDTDSGIIQEFNYVLNDKNK